MIVISRIDDAGTGRHDRQVRLIVQGNRSMSWRANVFLAISLCTVSMSVAIVLAAYGLWLVIPFAGLEFLALLFCLYLTQKRLDHKEVITVGAEAIQLEWGYVGPQKSVNLPRQWTRLRYHCRDNLFDTGQLSVAAHGRSYLLGNALGRDEKRKLYTELDTLLRGESVPA